MIDNVDFGSLAPIFVGYGCMLIALLFWFVWPKAKAQPYGENISWPRYILHYFHPLAWILFGLASFFQVRQPIIAGLLLALGGIVYLTFIVIFIKA